MAILDWFLPKDLEEVVSTYNGKIKVKKFMGRVAVWCGSYEQSGPMVKKVWEKALEKILPPKKVLVLGLGCGSVAEIISNKFPGAKITGVDIDPVMIRLGKKYFDLSRVRIVIGDAFSFIRITKQKYDLILVDLYLGGNFPSKLSSPIFFKNCRGKLYPNGQVIFNYLKFGRTKEEQKKFVATVSHFFRIDKQLNTEYNLLLYSGFL